MSEGHPGSSDAEEQPAGDQVGGGARCDAPDRQAEVEDEDSSGRLLNDVMEFTSSANLCLKL